MSEVRTSVRVHPPITTRTPELIDGGCKGFMAPKESDSSGRIPERPPWKEIAGRTDEHWCAHAVNG